MIATFVLSVFSSFFLHVALRAQDPGAGGAGAFGGKGGDDYVNPPSTGDGFVGAGGFGLDFGNVSGPKNDELRITSTFQAGKLIEIVEMILNASTAGKEPTVLFDDAAREAQLPVELKIRNATSIDALTLAATAANCRMEPIHSVDSAKRIIGYRFVRVAEQAKRSPSIYRYSRPTNDGVPSSNSFTRQTSPRLGQASPQPMVLRNQIDPEATLGSADSEQRTVRVYSISQRECRCESSLCRNLIR